MPRHLLWLVPALLLATPAAAPPPSPCRPAVQTETLSQLRALHQAERRWARHGPARYGYSYAYSAEWGFQTMQVEIGPAASPSVTGLRGTMQPPLPPRAVEDLFQQIRADLNQLSCFTRTTYDVYYDPVDGHPTGFGTRTPGVEDVDFEVAIRHFQALP